MKLQDTLTAMKEKFEAGLPPEVRTLMHKATDDLEQSGIIENVQKPGEKIVHFTLPDEQEHTVSSKDLVVKGPLVISFYRGVW